MAASRKTIEALAVVIRRRLDKKTIALIVQDLALVEGNASFRATVKMLADELSK